MSTGAFLYRGCNLAYRVEGEGAPVVFIQGVGVHGDGWKPQTDALREHFSCLSFDNRGMGASQPRAVPLSVAAMAEDTRALLDHLGWPSAHLVGHSLGGVVALDFALTHPRRVRSLALLCTMARGADATRLSRRMLWLGLRSRLGSRRMRREAFLQLVMPADALARADRAALAEELAALFGHDLADQPPVAMAQLGALRRYDATPRLGEIRVPTLVMSSSHDPIAPPRSGRALAAGISGAEYVEYPGASHGLPIQHAAEVNARLPRHFRAADGLDSVPVIA
jgi:pimeloyl-ACP methyl ester carboxylesterase